MSGCVSTSNDGPVTIAQQGSFCVDGRMVTAPGSYDPTLSPACSDGGRNFWIDRTTQRSSAAHW